jgi:hypothetical protein
MEITLTSMEGAAGIRLPRTFSNYQTVNAFIIGTLGTEERQGYNKVYYKIAKGEVVLSGRFDYKGFRTFLFQEHLIQTCQYHIKTGKITEKEYLDALNWLELESWMNEKFDAPRPKAEPPKYIPEVHRFEGTEYQKTKDLPLKEIAKRIKAEILQKYPEIKVSVKTDRYSHGCTLKIFITAFPYPLYQEGKICGRENRDYSEKAKETLKGIQQIADQYRWDESDPQTDYFANNFYCTPSFDWELVRDKEAIKEVKE